MADLAVYNQTIKVSSTNLANLLCKPVNSLMFLSTKMIMGSNPPKFSAMWYLECVL